MYIYIFVYVYVCVYIYIFFQIIIYVYMCVDTHVIIHFVLNYLHIQSHTIHTSMQTCITVQQPKSAPTRHATLGAETWIWWIPRRRRAKDHRSDPRHPEDERAEPQSLPSTRHRLPDILHKKGQRDLDIPGFRTWWTFESLKNGEI